MRGARYSGIVAFGDPTASYIADSFGIRAGPIARPRESEKRIQREFFSVSVAVSSPIDSVRPSKSTTSRLVDRYDMYERIHRTTKVGSVAFSISLSGRKGESGTNGTETRSMDAEPMAVEIFVSTTAPSASLVLRTTYHAGCPGHRKSGWLSICGGFARTWEISSCGRPKNIAAESA